jgi:deazaflavin-dependent oxidoreductase (nitroreductase family)
MLIARFSNLLSRPRWLAKRITRVHGFLLRRTRGRLASRNWFFGPRQRVLALTTIGRRSGSRRTTPLGYLRDGDDFAVVASNSGLDSPPAWWLNLQANPQAVVEDGNQKIPVRAVEVTEPAAKDRLWKKMTAVYKGYDGYTRKTDRVIPLGLLKPVS